MKNSQSGSETSKSKFVLGAGLEIVSVKSGERVSNDTIPTVETLSQINKFKVNKLASELMGITAGSRVKLFITGSTVMDGKYLIAVASDEDASAAKVLSPTSKEGFGSLLFNYAGVWSRMAQAIPDAAEKSGAAFVEEGVAIERSKTYYLDHKTIYEMVEVENYNDETPLVDPFTQEKYTKVFALVNVKTEAVDLTKEVPTRKKKSDTAADGQTAGEPTADEQGNDETPEFDPEA